MGNTDSKVLVRQQITKLCSETVSPDHKGFWSSLWKWPASADEVSNLVCTTETLRNLLEKQPDNFETLFIKCSTKLLELVAACQVTPAGTSEATQLLNCARILTRMLPFVYEHEHEELERTLLWTPISIPNPSSSSSSSSSPPPPAEAAATADGITPKDDGKDTDTIDGVPKSPMGASGPAPLGHLLVKGAIDLCLLPGICAALPDDEPLSKKHVWRAGIGRSDQAPGGFDGNRMEAVRFLFSVTSKRLYTAPTEAATIPDHILAPFIARPRAGDVAAAAAVEKQELLTLICSLLNTFLSYTPPGWIPYLSSETIPEELAGLCARWIACMALEVTVDADGRAHNAIRFYLGKLHRKPDLDFLCSNIARLLATFSKPDGWTGKFTHLGEETLAVLWVVLSSNRTFMEHLVASDHLQPTIFALLCAVLRDLGPNTSQTGAARVAVNILHLLSAEPSFCEKVAGFMGPPGVLPGKIGSGTTSLGDAIVVTVAHALLRAPRGKPVDGMVEQLVLVFSNLSPYLRNVGVAAAQRVTKMLTRTSEPAFIFGAQWNWRLLAWTLEAADNLLRYSFDSNVRVAYALLVEKKTFETITTMTFSWSVARAEHAGKGNEGEMDAAEVAAALEASFPAGSSNLELAPIKGKDKEHTVDEHFWTTRENSGGWIPSQAWWDSWYPFLPTSTLAEALLKLGPVVDEACTANDVSDAAILSKMRSSDAKNLFEPRPLTVRPYAANVQADVWTLTWMWAVAFSKGGGGSIGSQGVAQALPTLRPWNGTRPNLFPVVRG